MTSRSRHRLVSALLLMLVVFGGPGVSLAAIRLAQAPVIVCARDRRPKRAPRIAQAPPPNLPPPPVRLRLVWREQRPLDLLLRHELFQRPPPAAPSLA